MSASLGKRRYKANNSLRASARIYFACEVRVRYWEGEGERGYNMLLVSLIYRNNRKRTPPSITISDQNNLLIKGGHRAKQQKYSKVTQYQGKQDQPGKEGTSYMQRNVKSVLL